MEMEHRAIDALNPGEDVLELLVKKLDRLPKKTQEIFENSLMHRKQV